MEAASPATVHQLKISLHGATPPLWRRIQVPSLASLGFVHSVIQEAFGWEGFHLHRFSDARGREWGDLASSDGGATFADEEEADLATVLRVERGVLWYVYDFGDGWRHQIEVEKIMPLERSVTYPACTDGQSAAVPSEDIGGIWGLRELVRLVTHPDEEPPEHFADLVSHLRQEGYDPGAFDLGDLNARLANLRVREADKPFRTRTRTRQQVQRLTEEDLDFCTCGQCQAGDPVRSADGGYLTEDVLDEAEVFPAITLPPRTELAACARRAPLIGDAMNLAEWCASGRQVTGKGVLRRAEARQAVEELRLWQRDKALTDPGARAKALEGLRSAGDLPVLDAPWRFALHNGLITIRSGRAVPGPELPGPGDDERLLSFWQAMFTDEVGGLHDMGARVLPGMFGMLGDQFPSVVFPVLKFLYLLPDGEWLHIDGVLSSFDIQRRGAGTSLLSIFVIESTARLLKILSDFGAGDADWGTGQWRGDEAAATAMFGNAPLTRPDYRMRLTPLGRYGLNSILVSDGHTAHVVGDLAAADAVTLLDALPSYDPAAFGTEVAGWLAGRDEASAVTELLAAASGTDPALAGRRVAAVGALTLAKPDGAREILRVVAADGPDGSRQVAAGALANLGEEPPGYRQAAQQWLLVDLLTALSAGDLRSSLTPDLLGTVTANADDLWRSRHPATIDAMEATAAALRDSDKTLAKRLRRSAHKARGRG